MSFIYSRALVEAFSAATCSATDASAPSNASPTPKPCLWHDRTMEVSRHSRYGMTCEPLTEHRGAALLTWWLAAFPAKTSAQPVKAQASKASEAGSGPTWHASLARFDPDSCTWKTAQCSLLAGSGECSPTWPRSGMTRDGKCWELPMSARRTSATGSGFWPTVRVNGHYNRKGLSEKSGDGLATAVKRWPTPIKRDSRTVRGGARTKGSLGTQPLITQAAEREGVLTGHLNPTWVEWLMGWPAWWTALQPLATGRFQEWQQQHSESLPPSSTKEAA